MTERLRPSPERLRKLLEYDPETGRLTWKERTGRFAGSFNHWLAGAEAGTLRTDGYIAVKVDNAIYPAHHIIWAMVHGEWPERVRHRNRIDSDNRLANLRAVSLSDLKLEVSAELRARYRERMANDSPPRLCSAMSGELALTEAFTGV